MDDIAAWLEGLGLGRYARTFRDNDVDAEVLPRLTADDLIGLGVASVGHRRKLLDAIAGPAREATRPHPPPQRAPSRPHRRHPPTGPEGPSGGS